MKMRILTPKSTSSRAFNQMYIFMMRSECKTFKHIKMHMRMRIRENRRPGRPRAGLRIPESPSPVRRSSSRVRRSTVRAVRLDTALPMLNLVITIGCLVRVLLGPSSYSGHDNAPQYGDYEAQRHWMEITSNLAPTSWYVHAPPFNDLEYWGLDYPPLQGAHAYACGLVAHAFVPELVALGPASYGVSTLATHLFMRATVWVSDVALFLLPLILFLSLLLKTTKSSAAVRVAAYASWLGPPLLLIDHAHFQYNCVALGLILAALAAWGSALVTPPKSRSLLFHTALPAAAFVAALNFKHMSAYMALPVLATTLALAWSAPSASRSLILVLLNASVVLVSMAAIWSPWVAPWVSSGDAGPVLSVVSRLFPWERGLFEDKVASFWCVADPVLKTKTRFPLPTQRTLTTIATLATSIPPALMGGLALARLSSSPFSPRIRSESLKTMLLTFSAGALSFFLFSFHVHEKSILFPLLPLALLAPWYPRSVFGLVTVASFSMYHLLHRDGLAAPYTALTLSFALLSHVLFTSRPSLLQILSYLGMTALHMLDIFVLPPPSLPFLWPLAFAAFSFLHFAGAYFGIIYILWARVTAPWPPPSSQQQPHKLKAS